MITIAHISDLHFGREIPEIIQGLLLALALIRPDVVIISGDLTQRATTEEYQAAQQFLINLPYPYFIVPGNHDVSATDVVERFFNTWEKWQQYVTPNLEPVLSTPNYIAIGVNTARAAGWYFDWSRGQISPQQIDFVSNTAKDASPDQLRIVVAHHPFWLPEIAEYRDVVQNRDEAINAFQKAGVDLILSGHVHMAYTQLLQGVLIVHSSTTFSNRTSENNPNGFNIIRGNREQLTIDFMQWNKSEFVKKEQQVFKRNQGGWQLN